MKSKDLKALGIPAGPLLKQAQQLLATASAAGEDKQTLHATIQALARTPQDYLAHATFAPLAKALQEQETLRNSYVERKDTAPWQQWGNDIEGGAIDQMRNACSLPVAVAGALMPDAHHGYGLPIGGVLATRDAVIPFAVGMDIACRMKLTVLDLPVSMLTSSQDQLRQALEANTAFGVGAHFKKPKQHAVMDQDWQATRLLRGRKDKAWSQLGSSGSGNHFVEFGILTLDAADLGLEAGQYLALLSHSGSRGTGGEIAQFYSQLAQQQHPELPPKLQHLAWLDMTSEAGQEYWYSMELMGDYAAANHALIHRDICASLGAEKLLSVENHHNFAWREDHQGEEVIVHRKGATPAGAGVLGVIPGSMGTSGYLVRGLGQAAALHSASHGAGRKMSRSAARRAFKWDAVRDFLTSRQVTLLSAGIDEAPMAYKDIEQVMADQRDLVSPIARFDPRLVKMAAD